MPNTKSDFQFGDILLVPFPFTDQTMVKQRPAVVISSSVYNRQQRDLILLAVTSRADRPGSQLGESAIAKWKEAGLVKASRFKPVILTMKRDLIRKKIGSLADQDRGTLRHLLDEIIGR